MAVAQALYLLEHIQEINRTHEDFHGLVKINVNLIERGCIENNMFLFGISQQDFIDLLDLEKYAYQLKSMHEECSGRFVEELEELRQNSNMSADQLSTFAVDYKRDIKRCVRRSTEVFDQMVNDFWNLQRIHNYPRIQYTLNKSFFTYLGLFIVLVGCLVVYLLTLF